MRRRLPLLFVALLACAAPVAVQLPAAPDEPVAEAPSTPAQGAPLAAGVFTLSDESRDPFRSYAPDPVAPELPRTSLDVDVDLLSVVGVVTGIPDRRALVVGPDGVGHTLRRGQTIGRPVVAAGGVVRTWRVERIQDDAVVLVQRPNRDAPVRRRLPVRPG